MLMLTAALHVEDHHHETGLLHEIEIAMITLMSNISGLARVIDLAARREKDHIDLFESEGESESESEIMIGGTQLVEMTAETGTIAETSGEETT